MATPSFDKVLVANRGEIARRIFRTCRAMGLGTVAVYSDADRDAPHVRDADEAVHIGGAESSASYLVIARILEAAHRTGAGAIHPGYGFLAENADFAEACEAAGVVFIGPTPDAIRAMGSKIGAKALMIEHGVPVVPGFDGGDQSDDAFLEAAEVVGFPLLVKASAGGGGKGMRVANDVAELARALGAGRREARAAFGDDRLLIERYVERPRHVEIQILGDAHGHVVHCFERECTIQRRHQKILEESPSPALDDALRAAMGDAAVKAGQAIGYRSAGTVEFVLGPDRKFYFLEVNTRLQVEHPVTELVTGLDLVRLQIEVALGRPLPFTQADLTTRGHAIEARIYAEDPGDGFLPQTGTLADWHVPAHLDGARVDGGVESGSEVSIHYDPMLAKVMAWGENRAEATRRLARILSESSVQGVTTNRRFLVDVLRHPAWASGDLTTGFIAEHLAGWAAPAPSPRALRHAVVAATLLQATADAALHNPLPSLPMRFRNNSFRDAQYAWRHEDADIIVACRPDGRDGFVVTIDGEAALARVVAEAAPVVRVSVGGHDARARVVHGAGGAIFVHVFGEDVRLDAVPRFPDAADDGAGGGCRAPMTGKVQRVLVFVGEGVVAGQPLVVLEAMKMEHVLTAPHDGVVAEVLTEVGAVVQADEELIRLEAPADDEGASEP
ncbi:MAG: ATP-grasp domain-containing protein [Deltaproteobacteria bacterium]|nr:ATP-grasp domain-containing protein [Deltaproteobacteria bacterium]